MKTIILVDGFNFYHSIDINEDYHKYKWLDFHSLAKCFIRKNDTIAEINYFSAETKVDMNKLKRQRLYLDVLRQQKINVILGEFKRATRKCRKCNQWYKEWNEKLTDVNIATTLITKAFNNEYEKAIIVCADYDITPAAIAVKKYFPTKIIEVVIPIGRSGEQLKSMYDRHHQLKEDHLARSILPSEVVLDSGRIFKRPPEWT